MGRTLAGEKALNLLRQLITAFNVHQAATKERLHVRGAIALAGPLAHAASACGLLSRPVISALGIT